MENVFWWTRASMASGASWATWIGAVSIGLLAACAAEPAGSGGGAAAGAAGVGASSGAGGTSGIGGMSGVGGSSGVGGIAGSAGSGGLSGVGGGGGSAGDDCAGVTARAEAELLPTDVIWAIDTSGSMTASFPAIQQALSTFSQRVIDANIDAHIILLAGAGSGGNQGLCVPAPLGSGTCGGAVTPGGSAADSREPAFLHLDLPFGSTQGMPTLLDNYANYRHLLRPNARTQLVLTEDGAPLMTAAAVTAHIEGRMAATGSPAWNPGLMPGSYQWNAIACSTGMGTGTCFLAFGVIPQTTLDLVSQTQGLLRNLDDAGKPGAVDPFADLLDRLAEQVIVGARVSCDYPIPEAPQGQTFNRMLVNVVHTSGSQTQVFPRAPDNVPCMDSLAWKYDNELTPTRVVLCPAACTLAQQDVNAEINVSFGCDTEILIPD